MIWPTALEWVAIIGTLGTLTILVLAWDRRGTKQMLQEQGRFMGQMDAGQRQAHEDTKALLAQMECQAR